MSCKFSALTLRDLAFKTAFFFPPWAKIPIGPGYRVPSVQKVRTQVDIATGAVGLITEPGQADVMIMGRELPKPVLADGGCQNVTSRCRLAGAIPKSKTRLI
jgi:hypothetical protein